MTVFTSNISESNSGGNITLDHLVDATAGFKVTGGDGNFDLRTLTTKSTSSGTYSIMSTPTQDGGSTFLRSFYSSPSVSSGTVPAVVHYYARQGTFSGTVTEQMGFAVDGNLAGATTNYGFHSNLKAVDGSEYNFYAIGEAPNYFAGETEYDGGVRVTGNFLQVSSYRTDADNTASVRVNADVSTATNTQEIKLFDAYPGGTGGQAASLTGFRASTRLNSNADEVFGFYSAVGPSTLIDHWNFYATGTSPNYFGGTVSMPSGSTVGGSAITSDGRYKENISAAASQLDDVKALAALLVNYDWTDDSPIGEDLKASRYLGLVAQDVEEVCPGLVGETQMPGDQVLRTPEQTIPAVYGTNEDGDQYIVEESYVQEAQYDRPLVELKTLKLDAIQMKMLGAIGDLIAKNEELEARLDAAGV